MSFYESMPIAAEAPASGESNYITSESDGRFCHVLRIHKGDAVYFIVYHVYGGRLHRATTMRADMCINKSDNLIEAMTHFYERYNPPLPLFNTLQERFIVRRLVEWAGLSEPQ